MKIHLFYQPNFNMHQVGNYTVEISPQNSFIELSSQSKLQILLEVGMGDVRIVDRDKVTKEAA